jgi:hypothetical protein
MVSTRANGRVAVVIPVSDPSLLAESLDSIFLQSRPPDDVIVVSCDRVDPEPLRRALTPYAGGVLLLREPALCPAAVRNAGTAVTDAEFLAVLRCGDRWLPHFLMSQMHVLRHDATIDLSFTNGLVAGDSALAGTFLLPSLAGAITLQALLAHGRALPCSAVVTRRASVLAAGGFDPAARNCLDFDLWVRMASRRLRFHGIDKPLTLCRQGVVSAGDAEVAALDAAIRTMRRLAGTPHWESDRAVVDRAIAVLGVQAEQRRGRLLLERGDVRAARVAFAAACNGSHGWQVRATRLALAVAPWIVRRVYVAAQAHARANANANANANARTATLSLAS